VPYTKTACDASADGLAIEFIPYVFQLFAALLEPNPSGALPDRYMNLVTQLVVPTLWETRGNVPGCTRLLAAIIPRAADLIVSENQVEPILGIFQKLLSGKKTEQSAFEILESIVTSLPK
jgi:exportin-2 (importin alpha re-exporter)